MARRFCETVKRVEDLVAYRLPTRGLALQMRAAGSSAVPNPRVHTFRDAMMLCLEKGQATEEQVKKWVEEDE
jgi:hypothetical protein